MHVVIAMPIWRELTAANADFWVKNAPGSEANILRALLAAVVAKKKSGGMIGSIPGINGASVQMMPWFLWLW